MAIIVPEDCGGAVTLTETSPTGDFKMFPSGFQVRIVTEHGITDREQFVIANFNGRQIAPSHDFAIEKRDGLLLGALALYAPPRAARRGERKTGRGRGAGGPAEAGGGKQLRVFLPSFRSALYAII